MKQARRKELKRNLLSVKLEELYDASRRYAIHLLAGAAVVVLFVVVVLTMNLRAEAQRQEAWNAYLEVRQMDPAANGEQVLDSARRLVADYGNHPEMGLLARDTLGRLLYARAMTLDPHAEREEYLKLLNDARSAYRDLIAGANSRDEVATRARMMLAAVEETLVLAADEDPEPVRALYAEIIAEDPSVYGPLARNLLDTLDERLRKLDLVATRPADPEAEPDAAPPAVESFLDIPAFEALPPGALPTDPGDVPETFELPRALPDEPAAPEEAEPADDEQAPGLPPE